MNAAAAQATQRALDDALTPLAQPTPYVFESNAEFMWRAWDAAVEDLEFSSSLERRHVAAQ